MSIKKEFILNTFQELIFNELGKPLTNVTDLKADASERKIYRLFTDDRTMIGIYNEDVKENLAFINFTNTFIELGFNVPKVYRVSGDSLFYLEDDLGDATLFSHVSDTKKNNHMNYYKQALADLIKFQIKSAAGLDFDFCYQTREFNIEMVQSDMQKFYDYYNMTDTETAYEGDINDVILEYTRRVLSDVRKDFFLYRDFQPRNIMIKDGSLYYIDYQSGRMGPLQYDVASFLYSGSINISDDERSSLLNFYIDELGETTDLRRDDFTKYFYFFVLIRLLQMLGSYSYLSVRRNDKKILKKIPKALSNLRSIIGKIDNAEINKFLSALTSRVSV